MKSLRILVVLLALAAPPIVGLLFTYEIIKVDWVSFMENQPSYRPMEDPLPLPKGAVPVDGPVYVPGVPWPNPVPADEVSLARGETLYNIYCAVCHGPQGKGDGVMKAYLKTSPPPDLTSPAVASRDDVSIFNMMTFGGGTMPNFRDLTVRERWDIVNYVRKLQKDAGVEIGPKAPAQPPAAEQPATGETGEVTVEVVAPLFQKGGCGSCHVIEGIEGAMGTLGPDLCVTGEAVQKGEKTMEDVIQDIVDPNAVVAEGYSPVMPTNFGDLYSQEELELMARYMATLTCKE